MLEGKVFTFLELSTGTCEPRWAVELKGGKTTSTIVSCDKGHIKKDGISTNALAQKGIPTHSSCPTLIKR